MPWPIYPWRDLACWAEERMVLTTTQKALLLTGGIAIESETMVNVWDKCYNYHDSVFIKRDCFWAVRKAIIRWCLELAALDRITNWWDACRQFYLVLVGGLNDIIVDLGNRMGILI
jgi:hypothetical protein